MSGSAGTGGQLIFEDDFNACQKTSWHVGSRPTEALSAWFLNTNISDDGAGNGILTTKSDTVMPGFNWSTAVLQQPASFLYGTVEVRAKMPNVTGTFPAIWLLGDTCRKPHLFHIDDGEDPNCTWPNAGGEELDILERWSSSFVHQGIHYGSNNPECDPTGVDVSAWHTYRIEWTAGSAVWKIDGVTTCTVSGAAVPDHPMFLILQTEVGSISGQPNPIDFPQAFTIDYARIWQ